MNRAVKEVYKEYSIDLFFIFLTDVVLIRVWGVSP